MLVRAVLKAGQRSAAALSLLVLTSCAVQLTEPYNAQIEEGLNAYHKSVVTFVRKMELAANKAEGRYDRPEVRAFYAESDGVLTNLVVKAEADAPGGNCAGSRIAAKGAEIFIFQTTDQLSRVVARIDGVDAQQLSDSVAKLNDDSSELRRGSCTVVVLNALRLNHQALESLHRDEVFLKPPISTIALDIIGDGVRVALINENAKK